MTTSKSTESVRLHLGCGRDVRPGWVNVDSQPGEGVEVVCDLDALADARLPLGDDSVDEFLGSHLLEHLRNPLPFMQELHRVAKPGAMLTFHVPYGSSDDAYTDPTHHRPYFIQSFGFFSQPYYWRADYGYRGDWQPGYVLLKVDGTEFAGQNPDQILSAVMTLRNVVQEMTVVMTAIKPIRAQDRSLQQQPHIEFQLVGDPVGDPVAENAQC